VKKILFQEKRQVFIAQINALQVLELNLQLLYVLTVTKHSNLKHTSKNVALLLVQEKTGQFGEIVKFAEKNFELKENVKILIFIAQINAHIPQGF
jgi:hypothetical protein